MAGIDLNLLQFLKKAHGPGWQPELVKETEWSYVYKVGEKSYYYASKFLADENFAVNASELRERWPKMAENDRLDFALHFWNKEHWTSNDTELLEILMKDGSDRIWENCAQALLKHPDRERAVRFLIERLEKSAPEHEPLNYIQALGQSKDSRAVPAIQQYYQKYLRALESEKETGIPEDVVFGPIPYHAYLSTCGALFKITGSAEYEEGLRRYMNHPSEQVRCWAENALETVGPTTAKRNAEFPGSFFEEREDERD